MKRIEHDSRIYIDERTRVTVASRNAQLQSTAATAGQELYKIIKKTNKLLSD